MLSLLCCCYTPAAFSLESLSLIDKALGNIKNSHKALNFIGLLEHINNKVSLIHYQFTNTSPHAVTQQ